MENKGDPKRKYSVISMPQKLEALSRIDRGMPIIKVAAELGVDCRTIGRWKRKRVEIEDWCSTTGGSYKLKDRSKMRSAVNQYLEDALFIWFNQLRSQGITISGPILRAQALKLYEEMGGDEDFVASEGWLSKWKTRHGVRLLTNFKDKSSADRSSVQEFRESFLKTVEDEFLVPDQVFNCAETGLNFRMLPSKTLSPGTEETAPGYNRNKEHVTVLACSNASGSLKLPLMVIGKSARPRAFKTMNMNNMPVFYRSHRSPWMNSKLFKEWFNLEFVPRVTLFLEERGLPSKAILIVDNVPSHPLPEDLKEGGIKTISFPPNVASIIQPMNQGVLENLKKEYRYKLMTSILEALDGGSNVVEHLETITMKDVIFWLAGAWDEITTSSIEKSWNKTWLGSGFHLTEEERVRPEHQEIEEEFLKVFRTIEGCEHFDKQDFQDWMVTDDVTVPILTNAEIISMVMEDQDQQDHDRGAEKLPEHKNVTHEEAKMMCEYLLAYFENQPDFPTSMLMALCRARNRAAFYTMQRRV